MLNDDDDDDDDVDDDDDDDDDNDDDDLTVVGPLPRSKENSRKESRRSRAIQSPLPEVTVMRVGHEFC